MSPDTAETAFAAAPGHPEWRTVTVRRAMAGCTGASATTHGCAGTVYGGCGAWQADVGADAANAAAVGAGAAGARGGVDDGGALGAALQGALGQALGKAAAGSKEGPQEVRRALAPCGSPSDLAVPSITLAPQYVWLSGKTGPVMCACVA